MSSFLHCAASIIRQMRPLRKTTLFRRNVPSAYKDTDLHRWQRNDKTADLRIDFANMVHRPISNDFLLLVISLTFFAFRTVVAISCVEHLNLTKNFGATSRSLLSKERKRNHRGQQNETMKYLENNSAGTGLTNWSQETATTMGSRLLDVLQKNSMKHIGFCSQIIPIPQVFGSNTAKRTSNNLLSMKLIILNDKESAYN